MKMRSLAKVLVQNLLMDMAIADRYGYLLLIAK